MHSALRVVLVWMVGLALFTILDSGPHFLMIFVTFLIFMTLPGLACLAVALAVETMILRTRYRWFALAVGPAIGILALYVLTIPTTPNNDTAFSDFLPLVAIVTVLWSATCFAKLYRRTD